MSMVWSIAIVGSPGVMELGINRELARQSGAWHCRKYSSDIRLEMNEITVREAKLGLWPDVRYVAPVGLAADL